MTRPTKFGEPLPVAAARKAEWNAKNREKKRESERAHYTKKTAKPFAGFDGEGWTDAGGGHSLFILRAGEHELYTGEPLDIWEILEWLCELPKDVYYVGFSLGYDWTMILRGLPRERFLKLHDRESRTVGERGLTLPVDWGPFRLDLISGKRFTVSLRDQPKKRFMVEDVLGCFQSTFAKAVDDWKVTSQDEQAFIEDMKQFRSRFAEIAESEIGVNTIRRYNELECVLLARLMERVRDACNAQKINPSSWFGAGQLAQAILRKHHAKDYMAGFDPKFERAADDAYYGGFFDVSEVGYFPKLYEYDISSAYPHVMRGLPCLAHAKLVRGSVGTRTLYRVRWSPKNVAKPPSWGAFPLRHGRGERVYTGRETTYADLVRALGFTPGTLYYPLYGEGWYWDSEVRAVANRDEFEIEVLDSYSLVSSCDCEPFGWIPELYDYRKKLGKSGQGMVLKLGLNSLYGKLAQSVGRPMFANKVYAGMITSGTRAMIHNAIRKAGPDDVVMVATDAVYSKRPIPGMNLGSGLGDWEAKEFGEYVVILPGLHFAADASKLRTRSIPSRIIRDSLERIREHWYSPQRWEPIVFPIQGFVSCQLAYHLGRDALRGQWVELPRSIRFGSPDKRLLPPDTLYVEDSVRLPLWGNVERLPSGHRTDWDYGEWLRKEAERERGFPDWDSIRDSQPDWVDPVALWE